MRLGGKKRAVYSVVLLAWIFPQHIHGVLSRQGHRDYHGETLELVLLRLGLEWGTWLNNF